MAVKIRFTKGQILRLMDHINKTITYIRMTIPEDRDGNPIPSRDSKTIQLLRALESDVERIMFKLRGGNDGDERSDPEA